MFSFHSFPFSAKNASISAENFLHTAMLTVATHSNLKSIAVFTFLMTSINV